MESVFISIIIPVRNEEKVLSKLVECINKINYPEDSFEVIFIDDHSTDNSRLLLKSVCAKIPNSRLLFNPDGVNGKKASIMHGIQSSIGELLLFTDADCVFSPQRLNDFSRFYVANNEPELIIGLVDYLTSGKLSQKLMRLEFLSLILAGAGFAGKGTPVFCNGANLAVKKSVFERDVDIKRNIASGDDVFLLHALKEQQKRIKLLKTKKSVVYTNAPNGIKEFLRQRLRWGAKSLQYTDRETIILSLVVFSTNLFLPVAFVYGVLSNTYSLFIVGVGMKFIVDILFFISGSKFFNIGNYIFYLPFLEILHPFYIAGIAITGFTKKPFHWKGRIIKPYID